MSITRVNGIGWGTGDKLTSAQANALDVNTTCALDKRAGQTDTLGSAVTCSGAGRVIPTVMVAPAANADVYANGGNRVVYVQNAGEFTYTLRNAGASLGDMVLFVGDAETSGMGAIATIKRDGGDTLGVVQGYSPSGASQRWLECMFDGTRWAVARSPRETTAAYTQFTSSTTWTCNRSGLYLITGYGGGGGGGCGTSGTTDSNKSACGGSGGGGSIARTELAYLTQGTSYTITIGPGGAGGIVGSGSVGADGGDTSIVGTGVSLTFVGAQGGAAILELADPSGTLVLEAIGGAPVRTVAEILPGWGSARKISFDEAAAPFVTTSFRAQPPPGSGGNGTITSASSNRRRGFGSSASANGGVGGVNGADSGSYRGGGGGGGGGAGPINSTTSPNGGRGGDGGASPPYSATAGVAAAANSGWGGGGGGGGGCNATPGAAANGGNGGSGKLTLACVQ